MLKDPSMKKNSENKTESKNSSLIDEGLTGSLEKSQYEARFYFSVILFIITFIVCMGLKSFRNKPFLPSKVMIIMK